MEHRALIREVKVKFNPWEEADIIRPLAFKVGKALIFKPWEIRLLDCMNRGLSFEEAVSHLRLEPTKASYFLSSKKAQEYIQDLVREKMAANGWTFEHWVSEGDKVWHGVEKKNREQMEVWRNFGERFAPRPNKPGSEEKPVINININALTEADRRIQEKKEAINVEQLSS